MKHFNARFKIAACDSQLTSSQSSPSGLQLRSHNPRTRRFKQKYSSEHEIPSISSFENSQAAEIATNFIISPQEIEEVVDFFANNSTKSPTYTVQMIINRLADHVSRINFC